MRMLAALLTLPTLLPASAEAATFTDVTADAGIDYVQWSREADASLGGIPLMTGGAAAGDFDGDGWTDLFVTRFGATDILYRNRGDGTFEDVSAAAGFTASLGTNGAAWGDIDNDGDLDLHVTGLGTSQFYLYTNDGQGRFTEQAVERGFAATDIDIRRGFSVTLGDYDRDGFLDAHTNDWGTPNGGQSVARLYHNRGTAAPGHFEDVTEQAGVELAMVGGGPNFAVNGTFTFASRLSDFDNDGWPDLAVTGDFGTSRLFWNNGDGTFTDGTRAAGVGTDENGMGTAVGDYDGDGDLDWFVTSIYDPTDRCATEPCNWGASGNRLYRYDGDRSFSDQTDAAGVRDGAWGWGSAFLDFDHDGDLDLVMTNGVDMENSEMDDAFRDDPMKLWRNDGGRFTDVSIESGITDTRAGKGLLRFDYDNDGDLDLFVVNNGDQPVLYRNNTDGQADWLVVALEGVASNAQGIGSRIVLDPDRTVVGDEQVREIDGGSHFLGQSEAIAHFGLGDLGGRIDRLEIRWPSGLVQELYDVLPNQRLVVGERVPEPVTIVIAFMAVISVLGRRPEQRSSESEVSRRCPPSVYS